MLYCPYCGTEIKIGEKFCVHCGRQLPVDLENRISELHSNSGRSWLLPGMVLVIMLAALGSYYIYLQHTTNKAKELYTLGEQSFKEGELHTARNSFAEAAELTSGFPQAEISLQFMDIALKIDHSLKKADKLRENNEFQQALSVVNEAENELKNYRGSAVDQLLEKISTERETIKTAHLSERMKEEPDIDQLKLLLWEAEDLTGKEGADMAASIRDKIIAFTFSNASKQLNNYHFNDAKLLVDDGLKYAPASEKLRSLKTTIEKEQSAFENARIQRVEQAINTAAQDDQLNEKDAVKLLSVQAQKDGEGNLKVSGEVKSVATVPIGSIQAEYALITGDNEEIFSNKVYVYPEKLFPGEKGEFEFTHYEAGLQNEKPDVEVKKVTWYTDDE
ncbi:zinc-ribbon domain-containing protein [Virgibacillus xinjiangensis]|uniref:Zinc-ribbon domain-containing protein n=1 Tax=Virgibacillus xinjiangensis TaxID=393090 RepID=A0ABV7CU34_9BACI